jgi:ribonuclease BN (tRNA processing enzyme)
VVKDTFASGSNRQTFVHRVQFGDVTLSLHMKIFPVNKKLCLKNDGALEIVYIGMGSAFAKTLYQTNFLIIKGDSHIMVDFGTTGPQALRETTGLDPTDLKVILPTHSHSDHVGGIECLGLLNRYLSVRVLNKPQLKMIINEDYQKTLWDLTLRGGMGWNETDEQSRMLQFEDFFEAIRPKVLMEEPREVLEIEYGGIHLEMFRTMHIPEQASTWRSAFTSYGLFIDGRIFCSVDTRFDTDLIDMYADRSEIMFHDVQFYPGSVHAPLDELRTLPADVKKKMILIHYADDWEQHDISEFAAWGIQGARYVFD